MPQRMLGNLVLFRQQHHFLVGHAAETKQFKDGGRFKPGMQQRHPQAAVKVFLLCGAKGLAPDSPTGFAGFDMLAAIRAGAAEVESAAQR